MRRLEEKIFIYEERTAFFGELEANYLIYSSFSQYSEEYKEKYKS